ncbi:MAG: hypothetical protein IPJ81_17915 [Chitinophagaceae bacterium]|nr:hypothetical protein [Chitinophagaceae bacterium]
MDKKYVLNYLLERQDVLKISAIGKRAGVSNLNHIVNGNTDGRGYPATLADKHLPSLLKEIKRLNFK